MSRLAGVRAVSIPVDDQSAALPFYLDVLGCTLVRDRPTPGGGRWIELRPGAGDVGLTLEPAPAGVVRGAVLIRFATDDAAAAHAELRAAGVAVGDVLHWPGVPPMFAFRDPDGNAFSMTETGPAA